MSVTATISSVCTIAETLANNTDSAPAATRVVTHSSFNESASLSAGTTPPATTCACFVKALAAGGATVDLTGLTGTNGVSVNGTGLKVQYLRVKNLGANTLTVDCGDANGYDLAGATFSFTLAQDQWFEIYGNDATPDIGAVDCEIDLVGTTTQTSEWTIVMG